MFEAYTYETLMEEYLNGAPEGIDTRQGSIFYDSGAGIIMKIAKLFTDLDLVLKLTQLPTTAGEFLDIKAGEYGISRLEPTRAEYYFAYEGTAPKVGERFYTDKMYFTLCQSDDGELYLRADVAGTGGNDVAAGTPAIPLNNIDGLTASSFGTIRTYGTDQEDDDSLRERVRGKIAGAAENGNKQHYKTWCESVPGVGQARIAPLWNGPNTVMATLISPLGVPCTQSVVDAVQAYVDPATKGYTTTVDGVTYTVGDGLGEGVANLGAHFTAVAASSLEVSVSCSIELTPGYTQETAREAITASIKGYLLDIALNSDGEHASIVRYSSVGALISGLEAILDYSDLTLNGARENISVDTDSVPELAEVTISVL